LASSIKAHHTSQAEEELYFSHIDAKVDGLSGTKAMQIRKQIDAIRGLIKFLFFFCSIKFLLILNLRISSLKRILGFREEAIMTQQST
tara:strand:- start:2208 stop:2471 length:264 start_codon:yes stop_codon:yes gene_type:complete